MLALAVAAPAVGAREFGTIYVGGVAYRTFANLARVDPRTGIEPIISFTNFDQGGVALNDPRPRLPRGPLGGHHGELER